MRFREFMEIFDPNNDDPADEEIWQMKRNPNYRQQVQAPPRWQSPSPKKTIAPEEFAPNATIFINGFKQKFPELWCRFERETMLRKHDPVTTISDALDKMSPNRLYNLLRKETNRLRPCNLFAGGNDRLQKYLTSPLQFNPSIPQS